ncbi:MAG: PAS domain S-box protein, partial [Armatimonadota bacterium]
MERRDSSPPLDLSIGGSLPEGDARFRHLCDTAPVMIWTSGLDRLCDFFNKAWLDFTGRTMAQELGMGWAEGVHPEDVSRCLDTYTAAFAARQEFQMDYRLRRRDGQWRWLVDHGSPRYEADGAFMGYIGSCVDITERKLAEEALKASERTLSRIYDHSPDCLYLLQVEPVEEVGKGVQFRFVSVNATFLRVSGYASAQVIGAPMENVIARENVAVVRSHYETVLQTRQPLTYKETARLPAGVRYAEITLTPIFGSDDSVTHILGVIRDMTDHTETEIALRESEANFRALVMASSDALYRMNADWTEMRQLRGGHFLLDTENPSRTWLDRYIFSEDQPQ